MKAIVLTNYGPPDSLQLQEVAKPEPAADEVLVHIRAAAVNHVDAEKASGAMKQVFPLQFPWIPGYDFAGIIEAVGEQVKNVAIGDEVYGTSTTSGTYAEYVAISPDQIAGKPRTLGFIEAASVPVSAETAWQALFDHAHVSRGQTVLIHGGAGAVGTFAVQFAHQAGATVIVTASSKATDSLIALGADRVIDYKGERFDTLVSGVDAVIDLVGGDTQLRSYPIIKEGGYLVSITQPISAERAAHYKIHAQFAELKPTHEGLARIAQQIDEKQLTINQGNVYPLSQVTQAWYDLMGKPVSGHQKQSGRIVLQLTDER